MSKRRRGTGRVLRGPIERLKHTGDHVFQRDRTQEEDFDIHDGKAVVDQFLSLPGPTFAWEIRGQDPDPKKTISEAAFNLLGKQMGAWVGTRIWRRIQAVPELAPKRIQVSVTVTLDGEEIEVDLDDIPYFQWADGQHREEARC